MSQQQKCTLKHGNFEKTPSDIAEKTGKDNYDVEFTFSTGMKMYGVLTDNGSKIVSKFDPSKIEELTWMSSEELQELIDTGDSLDAISCPYKMQPENKVTRYIILGFNFNLNLRTLQNVSLPLQTWPINLDFM